MSSLISQRLVDAESVLVEAASEVAEKSLFTVVDLADVSAFTAGVRTGGPRGHLVAVVGFSGPWRGSFELTIPVPLARRLSAAFAGVDALDDIAETALLDFTGELTNMLCGAWLTKLCPADAFDLTAPKVARPAHVHHDAHTVSTPSHQTYLNVDDTPVRILVHEDAALASRPAETSRAR